MRELVKIFGSYYMERDRDRRAWLGLKKRRSNPESARYLSAYLKEFHGVEASPPSEQARPVFDGPVPSEGAIAEAMDGLGSETDVELLRRKVVRLAEARASTEKERDELRVRLSKLEGALSNIDNVITSDLDSAADKAKKLELLKVVFEENKKLRKDLDG